MLLVVEVVDITLMVVLELLELAVMVLHRDKLVQAMGFQEQMVVVVVVVGPQHLVSQQLEVQVVRVLL
jgi:hypothetical protein